MKRRRHLRNRGKHCRRRNRSQEAAKRHYCDDDAFAVGWEFIVNLLAGLRLNNNGWHVMVTDGAYRVLEWLSFFSRREGGDVYFWILYT